MPKNAQKPMIIWLLLVVLCVFAMVVVGGLTRLTESGLSIVEWKPLTGILPPLGIKAWGEAFAQYQQSPQFVQINRFMTLEQFKGIFWLEYLHRLFARMIGILFLLPFLYFVQRHMLPKWLKWRLWGIFALGGAQGLIGWYMVKSGLVHNPAVSQYRLALHLGVALLILAACIWTALEINKPETRNLKIAPFSSMVALAIFIQILLGALVAGLDAGLTYNTFPLMDGHWIPEGLYTLTPLWKNHFENITMVQFQHRCGAGILSILVPCFAFFAHKQAINTGLKKRLVLLVGLLWTQIALGVSALVFMVPVALASLHQAVAVLLFAMSVWVAWDTRSAK